MERILSKEEIAELLSAVMDGQIETEPPLDADEDHREISRLDLAQSHSIGRLRIGNLDLILDAFARNSGLSITNRLQRPVSMQRISIEPKQFDPFLSGLSKNSVIGIIRLDPFKYSGLFILDPNLAFYLVEAMLGGSISSSPLLLKRPLTAIEINILRSVMKNSCADLEKAFTPITELDSSILRIETDPRLVNIVSPDTDVMVITYAVNADNLEGGAFTLVIPYASLESLRDKLKEGIVDISSTRTVSWTDQLIQALPELELEITAQSGEIALPINKILDLKVDDVVFLDYDPNTPLRILVEQKPKFRAMAGIHKGKKAVRITSKIDQS